VQKETDLLFVFYMGQNYKIVIFMGTKL